LQRRLPHGLRVTSTPEAESAQRLVDDAERKVGLCGVPASDADPKIPGRGVPGTIEHGGLSQARFANDEQTSSPTLSGPGQQALDCPQCPVALPDRWLGLAPPLPRQS